MARRKSKRAAEEDDLDITPMIDVTFLLLIFFMVTSTMEPEGGLKIRPRRTGWG
ncbi:MAG: biopolymer transporter ExbD [Planctomycetaceae bacterium]